MSRRLRPLLGLLLAVACSDPPSGEPAPAARGPNVLLLTLESLRTDHVGAYGGRSRSRPEIPVTPAIDAFAARATVFEDAHSVTSWTLAAHASLFTGLLPSAHQTDGPRDRLDGSYTTLAETLAAHGYQTAGVVSGPYLRPTHNLHQGFQHWDHSMASLTNNLAHDDVTNPRMEEALVRFLREDRDPGRPFFLFAYFWDPHFDFLPPPPYDEMFQGPESEPIDLRGFDTNPGLHAGISAGALDYVFSQYAGELRWTDEHVGRVFRLLEELGLWDDTLVILTADHGEEFFDHGQKGHKKNLYAETTRVPLVVKFPGQREGRRDGRLASLVDVVPTVLEAAGIELRVPMHGHSLADPPPGPDRALVYELLALHYFRKPDGEVVADRRRSYGLRQGDYRLLWSDGPGAASAPELYDVSRDPTEQNDLAEGQAERAAALRARFDAELERARRIASRYRRGGTAQLTAEEVEQLRELGYLGP